jgi:hypothetical protein
MAGALLSPAGRLSPPQTLGTRARPRSLVLGPSERIRVLKLDLLLSFLIELAAVIVGHVKPLWQIDCAQLTPVGIAIIFPCLIVVPSTHAESRRAAQNLDKQLSRGQAVLKLNYEVKPFEKYLRETPLLPGSAVSSPQIAALLRVQFRANKALALGALQKKESDALGLLATMNSRASALSHMVRKITSLRPQSADFKYLLFLVPGIRSHVNCPHERDSSPCKLLVAQRKVSVHHIDNK